ncbi:MAG: 50S ribosomal protein L13 [Candidatus Atribacteria bacterium]|nr:50S ribosomal protein L13 [Candidatus Atribacteria bacterium]
MILKTYIPSVKEIEHKWYVIDASQYTLGRMATQIAKTLLGKNKPIFTPFLDTGDYVVVINAEKVQVTGKKLDQKLYRHHTGYPGGFREETMRHLLKRRPEEIVRRAVWGMISHNRLGSRIIGKLKVYTGNKHPHASQNPIPLEIRSE